MWQFGTFFPSVLSDALLLYFLMMLGDFDPFSWWRIEEDLLIRDGEQIWIREFMYSASWNWRKEELLENIMFGVYADWMICIHCLVWWINTTDVPGDHPSQTRLTIDIISEMKGGTFIFSEWIFLSISRWARVATCYIRLLIIQTRNYETLQLWTWFQTFKVCNTDNILVACKLWHSNL